MATLCDTNGEPMEWPKFGRDPYERDEFYDRLKKDRFGNYQIMTDDELEGGEAI